MFALLELVISVEYIYIYIIGVIKFFFFNMYFILISFNMNLMMNSFSRYNISILIDHSF